MTDGRIYRRKSDFLPGLCQALFTQADPENCGAEMRSMMKTTFNIQFSGKELTEKDMIARVKELWAASGNKIKDIQTLNIYCKPEESMYYYVINDSFSGSVSM